MLTLYHAPKSRSFGVLTLLHELGAIDRVEIVPVSIQRGDGSGGPDPRNPHPEGKVPYLVHDGEGIRERAAIFAWLTQRFPAAGLAPNPGEPGWGRYLSWLAWYQGVVEPVYLLDHLRISDPALTGTFRDTAAVAAALEAALSAGPYLLGDRYSAADTLIAGLYGWRPEITPDVPAIRDWAARCNGRPSVAAAAAYDAGLG